MNERVRPEEYLALGFRECVEREFSFLLNEGYRLAGVEESYWLSMATYESEQTVVKVAHERTDYGLYFLVEDLSDPNKVASDYMILEAAGVSREQSLRPETPEQMRRDVALLAEPLRTYGRGALNGDPELWAAIKAISRAYTDWASRKGPHA